MRIGIDARAILNPEKSAPSGVAHYVWHLLNNLLEIGSPRSPGLGEAGSSSGEAGRDNQFVLFFDARAREKDIKRFTRPNVKIKFFPFSDYKKYMPGAYSEILGMATYVREKLDILHATSPLNRVPASYRGKIVTTFYDFAPYRVPDLFPRFSSARIKAIYKFMAAKSDRIIAVSESTKKDAHEFLGYPLEKMDVIYNGLDKRFLGQADYAAQDLEKLYGIRNKYILFLGTLEPRKNLTRVMEGFANFKKNFRGNFDYQLVVAGKRGWLTAEYFQLAEDLSIKEDVIFTGWVGGDELGLLYSRAEFFVMPSLYEGFGQTIVEAMACGAPCLVSKIASIPEIVGDAAYFVDPHDTEGIARGMEKLATDKDLRDSLSAAGREQAKKFSWEKCARETLEVYKKLKK